MIKTDSLCKSFGSLRALDNISLHAAEGCIFGLVGPDGAGKTTLIRVICGLIVPDSGTVRLLNKDSFGYMPQKFSLYGDLTVMENINFFGSMYKLSRKTIALRADKILELTNLIRFKERFADNLSGGMKQKLALTCALISEPRLLVLDEPTFGVDPESRKEFWKILYRLNKEGMTILVSTPYMDEAELCQQVGFINNGKLVAVDTPKNFKANFSYQIIEVKANTKDAEIFNGIDGLIDVSFFGNKYHLVTGNFTKTKQAAETVLQQKGKELHSLRCIQPTMEDVFIFMAEKGVG